MAQYVYTMRRVGKVVPPKRSILKNISLNFFPGAKIGVLGLNGSGKSSLLKIMAGVDDNYEGEVIRMPGIKVGYLEQEPKLSPGATVRQAVEESQGNAAAAKKRLDEIYAAYAEPDADFDKLAEEQARLEGMINAGGADELEVAAHALRLAPWEQTVGVLSGGAKRRVALCRLLLSMPDLLLLDEPTNHLDAESVEWLEQFLSRFPRTVVAVTHDRYFLDNAAGWILELDRGFGIPWEGDYSSWLEQKQKRLEHEASQEVARIQTVHLAHVDQSRDELSADKSVWEDVSGGQDMISVGKFEMPSRAYIARFNFRGADQQKPVGQLSGGERGRLHLAKMLRSGANVLLLDEPSNDLDVETLRALEEALLEFAGSVLVISHDRWFLDRIATHILAAEDDSQWLFFAGNYQEYEADKKKRLGEEAARPHRMRFKPLAK